MMNQDPILVYQMGKVGSSSIAAALTDIGLRVFHIHSLNPAVIDQLVIRNKERDLPSIPHVQRSLEVREQFLAKGKPLKIISAVREPVARNISAYFQNLNLHGVKLGSKSEKEDLQDLTNVFLMKYHHGVPLAWFDREMRDILSIDVFAYPFPKSDGTQRIQEKNMDILLLKAETLDHVKVSALKEFLQLCELSLEAKNVGAKKEYKLYYKAFLDHIQLPEAYIDRMYKSRYVQHFYTPEEIGKFRDRWTRKPATD